MSAAASYCHRFGTGIKAGVDLVLLLEKEAGLGPPAQQKAFSEVASGARNGEQLADMMEHNKFFPPLMVAMTRVGETTGKLDRTMLQLADHYTNQVALRRKFLQSITWPVLQVIMGIMVVSLLIWLMGVLTPASGGQMTDMLGFGLRGESGVLKFWAICGTFLGVIGFLIWAFFRNLGGIQNLVPLIYKVPKIGPAIQTITITRFCGTLSLAMESGLDPPRSIRLALQSTGSEYYSGMSSHAAQAIENGASLAVALEATHLFPTDFLKRVEIGEISGADAESMQYMANEYEERAELALRSISMVASGVVWVSIAGFMIFMIYRIASVIFGAYQI